MDHCVFFPSLLGVIFTFFFFQCVYLFLLSLLFSLPPSIPSSFNITGKSHGPKSDNWKSSALVRFRGCKIVIGSQSWVRPEYSFCHPRYSLHPPKILSSRDNNLGLHCPFLKFQSTFKIVDFGGKTEKREKIQLSVSDQYQLSIQTIPTN